MHGENLKLTKLYVTFAGYNIQVSRKRHIYNRWLTNSMPYGVRRYDYDLAH